MLHTITLNPSLDLTCTVEDFHFDDTNRAAHVDREPGGSGINVSRVARRLGHPTVALGFLGGHTGQEVADLLEAEGVRTWMVTIPGMTRINPIVQDRLGRQLRVSLPGPEVSPDAVEVLWRSVFALRAPHWLIASGSRPGGVPPDFFARLIRQARAAGVPTAVDADGETLRGAVEAGADLIKPNRYELQRLVGHPLSTLADLVQAGRSLLRQESGGRGVGAVALSLGPDGALLIRPDGVWQAAPPPVAALSAVGAGDSLLAGLCASLADGLSPPDALAVGVACGTATAQTTGTHLCQADQVRALRPQVSVTTLSPD